MSAQVAPTIPPRPLRAQQAAALGVGKLPDVPPRPIPKRLDRSTSPGHFPRSPLNEPWANNNMTRQKTNEQTEVLPRRPSVQNLPSIGQEGMEYADLLDAQAHGAEADADQSASISTLTPDAGAQTRNIAHDLHLHAPKPSLPTSSAVAQVQAVTRTDSGQAAQHGFGKPSPTTPSQDDGEPMQRVRTRNSFSSRPSSAVGERRGSTYGAEEHGPAELGLRVPINPLLGDVQAPSPAVGLSPSHTGSNGERQKRPHHSRTKSGKEIFTPPGSYGLHGHGLPPQDKFEKDWYAKHPEAAQHEETHGHGVYESIGSGRGAFALSSDDLNKIVRNTASRGSRYGASAATYSVPDEQIGYAASEIFVTRSQGGTPINLAKSVTNASHPALESPLRKSSFPADETIVAEVRRGRRSISGRSDDAIESEGEQVHVEPSRRYNKVTGGEETLNETEDVKPYVGHATSEDGYFNEHGYSAPILAADEVAKEPGAEHMQPAVSPKQERRGSQYELDYRSGDATPSSRPSSRPSSVHGLHSANHALSRFVSHHEERDSLHTPLEDVDEYEPLFPDDDDGTKRPVNHVERFKQRPNVLKQRFPSQDIWEDTPASALYSATVSTPDLPLETEKTEPASKTFESPAQDAEPKGELSDTGGAKMIPIEDRLATSYFGPHLREDMPTRPGMVPRFPSSDVWEDSPESHYLVTTVSSQQIDEAVDTPVDVPAKPLIPPRPAAKSKLGDGPSAQVAPSVPARPQKNLQITSSAGATATDSGVAKSASPTELKKVPSIPDRPKPQVPARPAKKLSGDSLTKTVSGESADSEKVPPPVAKVKPQVPARPAVGSKIANLRGNFMNDLNQKLGLGPPKEKEPEPVVEDEPKPLEDARKGRAKGPQRRAPVVKAAASFAPPSSFAMFSPRALWTIDDDDEVNIPSYKAQASQLGDVPAPVGLSDEQVEAVDSANAAETPLHSMVETTDYATTNTATLTTQDEPAPGATELARNTARDLADSSLESPAEEKPALLSQASTNDSLGHSQHTTESVSQVSGADIEREIPDPSTDAIPVSKQTTASTEDGTAPLEMSPTQEPRTLKLHEGEPGKTSAEEA